MNTEILNQIQILNQHTIDLTQKSQDLINALKQSSGVDINTIITILAGLLGVVVGSLISYYFSKKITNESSKARFAIQRKNLIYSKIYKELIYMREQIELLPEKGFYFQMQTNLVDTDVNDWSGSNYWIVDNRDSIAPDFYVWKDIKSDIRITQVNNEVLGVMESLEKAILNYFNLIRKFREELNNNEKEQNVKFNLEITPFFFYDFNKEEYIEKDIKRYSGQTIEWMNARRELMLKVINPVMEKSFLQETKENFIILKDRVDGAYLTLEKIIKDIVNKYEYGEKI